MAKAVFHTYGITLPLPSGDVVLNAGPNMQILPQGNLITFSAQIPPNLVVNNLTPWQPPALADAKAPNNSVYYSTDATKLVYKGPDSVVHNLY